MRGGALLVISLVIGGVAACSSGKGTFTAPPESTSSMTTANISRPPGPAADVGTELTGGKGVFIGSTQPTADALTRAGYVEHEYAAAGTATSYKNDGPFSSDGRWTFSPDQTAPYRTRIIVRRPSQASAFSGNVVIEWLNVSGGIDADAEWASTNEELLRRGDMWVGVSAQLIGVMGGPVLVTVNVAGNDAAGKGLKGIDPERYGTLDHPGDGYSFDIFTQVARAIRAGGAVTGGLQPQRLIAAGESQSAFALVTYINGVQPLTRAFDGFFVHSRGAAGLPLAAPGEAAGIANAVGGTSAILRTDTDVPIVDVQTETDVGGILNSSGARQADSATFRLWEVAGTAHADRHVLGPAADVIGCGVPVNNGPMHIVVKAALHALKQWMQTGQAPPEAPLLTLASDTPPTLARDGDGIVTGGIRTPPVDVPVDTLSGTPAPNASIICLLSGTTTPLSAERLAQLYPSRADYQQRFSASADAAIAAGFVLPEDREALIGYSDPSRIVG